jgi:hypothetical protein
VIFAKHPLCKVHDEAIALLLSHQLLLSPVLHLKIYTLSQLPIVLISKSSVHVYTPAYLVTAMSLQALVVELHGIISVGALRSI